MKPKRYFVRVWTPDPAEEGPDDEKDGDVPSLAQAKLVAASLRRKGISAGAFERRNIRYPEHAPPGLDIPAHLYEWDTVQIDEDEIDRECAAGHT